MTTLEERLRALRGLDVPAPEPQPVPALRRRITRRHRRRLALTGMAASTLVIAGMAVAWPDSRQATQLDTVDENPDTTVVVTATSIPQTPTIPPTSIAGAAPESCPSPTLSSPAVFNSARGRYAAQGLVVSDDERSIRFNIVQWLSGDDAKRAWLADNSDEFDSPPDYLIVDESDRIRSAPVRADAAVFVLPNPGSPILVVGSLDTLGEHIEQSVAGIHGTYWLSFHDGVVIGICEQYRP